MPVCTLDGGNPPQPELSASRCGRRKSICSRKEVLPEVVLNKSFRIFQDMALQVPRRAKMRWESSVSKTHVPVDSPVAREFKSLSTDHPHENIRSALAFISAQ